MRIQTSLITPCIIFLMLFMYAFGLDNETKKIMPFVDDTSYCTRCHTSSDIQNKLGDPAITCDIYCLTCHKTITQKNHHPVNIKMTEPVEHDFHYSKFKKIMCVTCHDLHVDRFDSSPWKSQSLFDLTFRKKKKFKTYYLTIQNNKGQMCKTCH